MEMPTCALIGHAVQLSLWERLVLAFRLVWGGWLYTAIHLAPRPRRSTSPGPRSRSKPPSISSVPHTGRPGCIDSGAPRV